MKFRIIVPHPPTYHYIYVIHDTQKIDSLEIKTVQNFTTDARKKTHLFCVHLCYLSDLGEHNE